MRLAGQPTPHLATSRAGKVWSKCRRSLEGEAGMGFRCSYSRARAGIGTPGSRPPGSCRLMSSSRVVTSGARVDVCAHAWEKKKKKTKKKNGGMETRSVCPRR